MGYQKLLGACSLLILAKHFCRLVDCSLGENRAYCYKF